TPSQDAINRPEGGDDAQADGAPDSAPTAGTTGADGPYYDDLMYDDMFDRDQDRVFASTYADTTLADLGRNSVFGLLGLLVAGFAGRSLWRRGLDELQPVRRTWVKTWRLANWFALPHRPHQTPHEYATELGELVPRYAAHLRQIADAYVRAVFGR